MKLSIIIPARNRAPLLERQLITIFNQNFPPDLYEVLVIDDDSQDNTSALCQHYPLRYFPLKNRPKHTNPVLPFNIGIQEARGEILILAGGEMLHTPWTLKQLSELHHDQILFVSATVFPIVKEAMPRFDTPGYEIFPDGRKIPHWLNSFWGWCRQQDYPHWPDIQKYDWASGQRPLPFVTGSMYSGEQSRRCFFFCASIRRDFMLKVGGFDEDFIYPSYDDDNMAMRLRMAGIQEVYRNDCLVFHQWHEPDGASHYYPESPALFARKQKELEAGGSYIANPQKAWGKWSP